MGDARTYMDWVKHLPVEDSEYKNCSCPECGNVGLLYQYFGIENEDFGWKLVWCEACSSGIRISRTKLPNGGSVLFDEKDQNEFLENHSDLRLIL
jgi:hypothetical protein